MSDSFAVRIKAIRFEARNVHSYELVPLNGHLLPAFEPGAHIDFHLSNGLIRSYSLINPAAEQNRYVVAVARDPASRGGSEFIHQHLTVGMEIQISAPRNNFPLEENAGDSLFISGGIGITPFLCMINRLEILNRRWKLFYCTRTRQSAAFLEELAKVRSNVSTNLHFNFDQEPGGSMLDIAKVVAAAPVGSHLYCCGPLPMIDAFERACVGRPRELVHVEYFAARQAPAAAGGFEIVLAKAGLTFSVPAGKTILDVLLEAGIDAPYSCMEGICSTCETRVLEGVPDHRDLVLSQKQRDSNEMVMICCSGSKTAKLVLDL